MQTNSWIPLLPEQASTYAWQVDYLYYYLLLISAVFTVPIVIAIFYFAVRYRQTDKYATGADIHGSVLLETTWSIIPFIVSMTVFLGGAIVYYNQYRMPKDPDMQIYVVGKQWMWKIQHETGQREINELHIPVGKKVKLTMATEDVIHSFFIPDFRTKADVVPGRYTYLWFEATKPGKYHLFCAEYCGLNHSGMIGSVYVMEQRDFDNWLSGNAAGGTPVEVGRDLFTNKLGCASCHAGGPAQRGAKLEGMYGKEVKLVGGQTVIANDDYIRNSILNPSSQIVEGYQPIMPTFKGQVTEEQLVALVAYIKSLSGNAGNMPTGGSTTAPPPPTSTVGNKVPVPPRSGTNTPASNPNAPAAEPANKQR